MDDEVLNEESEKLLTKTRKSVSLADNVVILNGSARVSKSSEKSQQNLTDNEQSNSNTSSKKASRKDNSKRKVRRSSKSVHSISSKNNNKPIKSTHRISRTSTRNVSVATLIETKDCSTDIDTFLIANQNDSRLLASASNTSTLQNNIWKESSHGKENNCYTQWDERSNNNIITGEGMDHSNEIGSSSLSFIKNVFNKFKDKNSQIQSAQSTKNLSKESVSNLKKKMLRLFKPSGNSVTRDQSSSISLDESSKHSLDIGTKAENCKVPIVTLYRNEVPFKEVEQLMYALLNEVENRDIRATKSTPFTDNEQNLVNSYKNDIFERIWRKERTWLAEKPAAHKNQSNDMQKTDSRKPFPEDSLDFLETSNKSHENVSIETNSNNEKLAGSKLHLVHNIRSATRKSSLRCGFKKIRLSKKSSQVTANGKISGKNDFSKYQGVLMSSFPAGEINSDEKLLNKQKSIAINTGTEIRKVKSSTSLKSIKSLMKHSTMDISNDTAKLDSEQYYGYKIGLILSNPVMIDVGRTKSFTNICLNTSFDSNDIKVQSEHHDNVSQKQNSVIDEGLKKNSKYEKSGKISETTILGKILGTSDSKPGKKSKDRFMSGLYPWSPISDDISKEAEKIIIKPSSFQKSFVKESSSQNEKLLHQTKSTISDNSKERLKKDQNEELCKNENFVSISKHTTPIRNFDLSKTDSAILNAENSSTCTLPMENAVTKNVETQESLGLDDLNRLSGAKRFKNTSTNRSKNSLMAMISRHSKSSNKSSENNAHDKNKNEKNFKFHISTEYVSHMAFKDKDKLPEIATRKKREWITNSTENTQNNKSLTSTKDSEQTFKKTSSLLSRIFRSNRSTDKKTHDDKSSNSHYSTSNTADSIMASDIVNFGENMSPKGCDVSDVNASDATSTSKVYFDENSVTQQLGRHSKSTGLKNPNQDEHVEKSTASIFKRRSSLIMMAMPRSNGNTSIPITADSNEQYYYLYCFLGPPLDVALVDIVTVLQQLLDKISNSRTDRPR